MTAKTTVAIPKRILRTNIWIIVHKLMLLCMSDIKIVLVVQLSKSSLMEKDAVQDALFAPKLQNGIASNTAVMPACNHDQIT